MNSSVTRWLQVPDNDVAVGLPVESVNELVSE
jgi:hypothetical protein